MGLYIGAIRKFGCKKTNHSFLNDNSQPGTPYFIDGFVSEENISKPICLFSLPNV